MRSVGKYRLLAGISESAASDFATDSYIVRAQIRYSKLRFGHPDIAAYSSWAMQAINELRYNFDEQMIWARVKEDSE